MRYLKMALAAVSLVLYLSSASIAAAVPVEHPPRNQPKIESPLLITGYAFSGPKLLYVQLFNSSSEVVSVANWGVEYGISSQAESIEVAQLEGTVKPGGYIIIGEQTSVPSADFSYTLSGLGEGSVSTIKVIPSSLYLETTIAVKADVKNDYWKRNISSSTGSYLSTFSSFTPDNNYVLYGRGLYAPPTAATLQFTEVLANPRSCSPAENAGDCSDFVKLYNPAGQSVDLSQFRLRTGYKGQAATSSNSFSLAGIIAPGGYLAVAQSGDGRPVSLANGGSFLWLEDLYGVQRYDNTITEYPDASSDTKKGQAWAYDPDDGTWKWTLQPIATNSPSVFVLPSPKPKVITSGSLVPCKEGQYRSEETNRCRSVATATTALAPCDEDEERNPETNRCRKLASLSSSELAPCKEGQERNPETNRCRNIAAVPSDTAFKPEPVADTGKAFAGWWALGGVGALAVGYGAWEWRREVMELVQKVGTFFTSGK